MSKWQSNCRTDLYIDVGLNKIKNRIEIQNKYQKRIKY